MEIYVNIRQVMDDIGSKFLMELSSTDPLPPRGTVIQSLNEANARLAATIGKSYEFFYQEVAEDSLSSMETFRYELVLSPRRASGKAQPLADMVHSYLVNASLTKILSSMGQADLSAKHDAQAVSDAQTIDRLLHTKIPPRL